MIKFKDKIEADDEDTLRENERHAITITKFILYIKRKSLIWTRTKDVQRNFKHACQMRAILMEPDKVQDMELQVLNQLEADRWPQPEEHEVSAAYEAAVKRWTSTSSTTQKSTDTSSKKKSKKKKSVGRVAEHRIDDDDNAHSTVSTSLTDAVDHAAGEEFEKVGFGDSTKKRIHDSFGEIVSDGSILFERSGCEIQENSEQTGFGVSSDENLCSNKNPLPGRSS